MFNPWSPECAKERLPLVLAAVGARRSGKSTALMNLVYRSFDHFDLVIAFVGSAACCPVLEAMMERHPKWDTRFFFDAWNQPLIDKLLAQQQTLLKEGKERNVLILMDDVILTSKAADQLAHMCMRGRHFRVSVFMAAVSYTSISKRARRSLDYLLCFSCPMTGDRKVLSWEYASNSRTADFGLKNLGPNECVVFETGKQELHNWRAELLEPSMFRNGRLPVLARSGTQPLRPSEGQWAHRRIGTPCDQSRTECPGSGPASPRGPEPTDHLDEPPPGSDGECPPEALA